MCWLLKQELDKKPEETDVTKEKEENLFEDVIKDIDEDGASEIDSPKVVQDWLATLDDTTHMESYMTYREMATYWVEKYFKYTHNSETSLKRSKESLISYYKETTEIVQSLKDVTDVLQDKLTEINTLEKTTKQQKYNSSENLQQSQQIS